MSAETTSHPSSADLHSFAHGRLPAKEMAVVERHIAQCDSCCKVLESVPEDTLVQMAREAATEAFRAGETAAPRSTEADDAVPPELADHSRYRILGLVGRGGMGVVYKAEHRMMERLVALKVISRSFTANPQAVERFRREVKAAARLAHANIVTAHDAEQAGDLHFLVMEFVDGVSLDRLIVKQGKPTIPQACGLIRQAALGLQHAHEKGMVHRDIKPANLMVTRKGQVKILDFGLARLGRDLLSDETDVTAAGMVLGTPDYISPEQAADSRSADIRADIYSLGCTFYFLLSGKPPFPKGTPMQRLAAHMHETPPSLLLERSDIPAEVVAIVLRMMAKQPEARYQTPSEVAKDLAAVQKGTGGALPKLDPLKPPEDFFAGFDLAALPPAMPLPVQARLPNPATDISDWLADNKKLLSIGGIIAGCFLLFALCLWGAGKFFGGDEPSKTVQKQEAANLKPVEKQPVSAASPTIPATSSSLPRPNQPRVLFCVPHDGLFEQDFFRVMPTLSAQASVTVASTVGGPCKIWNGGGDSKVTPQVVIGRDSISAQDYDAIIFAGANTNEFHGEPTERLVREFERSGKLVTAICYGQEVLAHYKLLRSGVRVANSSYMTAIYDTTGCSPVDTSTVRHENLITGRDPDAGPAFAQMLLDAIQEKNR